FVPAVGDTYPAAVELEDGRVVPFTGKVTGVIDGLPEPIAPLGSSAADPDPLAPRFSWTAPTPVPASFAYRFAVRHHSANGDDVWRVEGLPPDTTFVDYDFDGTA